MQREAEAQRLKPVVLLLMRGSSQAKKQEVCTVSGVESGVGELQEILKNLEMASKPARRLIAISVPLTTFSSSTRPSAAFRERAKPVQVHIS